MRFYTLPIKYHLSIPVPVAQALSGELPGLCSSSHQLLNHDIPLDQFLPLAPVNLTHDDEMNVDQVVGQQGPRLYGDPQGLEGDFIGDSSDKGEQQIASGPNSILLTNESVHVQIWEIWHLVRWTQAIADFHLYRP